MSLADPGEMLTRLESAFGFVQAQTQCMLERAGERYPAFTEEGRWQYADEVKTTWCKGCWPGLLWVLTEATQEDRWRRPAEHFSRQIEPLAEKCPGSEGLLFYYGSHFRWLNAVGDDPTSRHIRSFLHATARTVADRFEENGGYIAMADDRERVQIESMMDVPLLLMVAADQDDDRLYEIAGRHVATVRRYLVRGDGSVAEEAEFQHASGACVRQVTAKGFRSDSCWSRGLGWAVHGFADSGKWLNFTPWLETARLCAGHLIEKLSGDPVPPWDFCAPAGSIEVKDSSAAAIAAGGLFALADAQQTIGSEEARQRRYYQEMALRIVAALCEPEYLAAGDDQWEGILKEGTYDEPEDLAINESLIWGDLFFADALIRAIHLIRSSQR